MARPRSFVRGRTGARRAVQWLGPADQAYVSVTSGGATLLSSFAFAEPATVTRTRGQVSVIPQAFTADVEFAGAIGMGIVSAEAFAVGIASVPEPFSDADWSGWFVWRSFSYHFEFGTAEAFAFPDWSFDVDSKAMRKVGPNEVVVIVAESQVGPYKISTLFRMLVKLHG